jgi:hypothetical protein
MKARTFLRATLVAAALGAVGAGQAAFAQDEPPAPNIGASYWTAVSAYYRPSAADTFAAAGLRGGVALDGSLFGEAAGGGLGLRLSLEAYSNFAGVADAASWAVTQPDPLSVLAAGNGRLEGALDLKEAWIDFALGDADLRLGKQLFAWGLADGNNPTDNLNARHVGTRFVSTLDEQKMGAIAANIVYNLPGNSGSVQGVFLPISVANDLPSMAMDLTITGSPIMHLVLKDDEAPAVALENIEGGLRALFYAGNLSFSASWLSYLDRYPDYKVASSFTTPPPKTTVVLTPFHSRVNQFGLDAAYLTGGNDLRTEWALTLSGDSTGNDPAVRNSSLSGVVQATRNFLDGALSTSLAWAPRLVLGHKKPGDYATTGDSYLADMLAGYNGQAYAFEQVGSVRIAGKLLNETVQPEALFLASLEARDFLATASLAYNLADGLNLKAGGGLYGSFRSPGDPEREWGLFSNSRTIDKSYLFVELRLSL